MFLFRGIQINAREVNAKHFIYAMACCLAALSMHGQAPTGMSSGLDQITDTLIRREIATFTVTGASLYTGDSSGKKKLREIATRYCDNGEVHLSWSTFTSSVSTFIHLYFTGEDTNRMLDSIFLVTHSHFYVRIPKSVCQGLRQPNTCNYRGGPKKENYYSPWIKAFYSADKRRLYIYMVGGAGSDKYEVTWVISDDRFFIRVMDRIP